MSAAGIARTSVHMYARYDEKVDNATGSLDASGLPASSGTHGVKHLPGQHKASPLPNRSQNRTSRTAEAPARSRAGASDLRIYCVELRGFEPLTPWMQTRCSSS